MDPLSDEEIGKVRQMISNFVQMTREEVEAMRSLVILQGRIEWMARVLKSVVIWVTTIAGFIIAKDTLMDALRSVLL